MINDQIASIIPYLIPADPRPLPWWAHKAYILVRVETRDGIVGWGECHNLTFREEAILAILRSITPIVTGQPAGDIRSLIESAFNSFGQHRPGLDVYAAFAGMEIALWDILGKRLGVPIFQLLGGSCRDGVPVYANIFSPHSQTADAFAKMAAEQVSAGHRMIKLYPFGKDTTISEGVKILSAVREAVGPEIGLAVDLWRHTSPQRAIDVARAIEPFNLLWIEDPFAPTEPETMRYVRDIIRQPLMAGETLPTRREFSGLFEARALDIVNPDICLSGLIELQAIATMAEVSYVRVSPHNSNSMAIGTSAAVHASLGIPNLEALELFPLFDTALDEFCQGRLRAKDGQISRPLTPGLGVEFDDAAMLKFQR